MPHDISSARLAAAMLGWHHETGPLYQSLARAIRQLVRRGALPPGTRLPSERSLAVTLSVSRGTVTSAYELLREDAYVTTRHGSGTVVIRARSPLTGPREGHVATLTRPDAVRAPATATGAIDLVGAVHRHEPLPLPAVDQALPSTSPAPPKDDDSDGDHGRGRTRIRQLLAAHLTAQGLPTTAQDLLITAGGQQALALVMLTHVGRSDRVVLEDLTYPGALQAVAFCEGMPVRVPRRGARLDIDDVAAAAARWDPRAIFVMASGHATDGAVMPSETRRRLAEMAADTGLLVVDDMSMAATVAPELELPALASFADRRAAHRFVTIGSLGKTLGPTYRLGWVRAESDQLDRMSHVQAVIGGGGARQDQVWAEHLLASPDVFGAHRRYATGRRRHMAELVAARLPDWHVQPSDAGMSLWVRLPGRAADFAASAEQFGVRIAPPEVTSAAVRGDDHLRLAVGHPTDVLDEAADRLRQAWHAHTDRRSNPAAWRTLAAS